MGGFGKSRFILDESGSRNFIHCDATLLLGKENNFVKMVRKMRILGTFRAFSSRMISQNTCRMAIFVSDESLCALMVVKGQETPSISPVIFLSWNVERFHVRV